MLEDCVDISRIKWRREAPSLSISIILVAVEHALIVYHL